MSSGDAAWRFKWVSILLSALLTLLLTEGALRLYSALRNRTNPPPIEVAAARGWRSRPNVNADYSMKAYGEVSYSTDERGFRSFGDPQSSHYKILTVGDSFTQAKQVSDGAPYYDRLKQLRPDTFEVFAYGAGGYGTLQELMVLEEYFEEIDPDVILWQFSFNDLVNNDYLLESASNERNNHMRRPYYEGGEVVFRHPDGGSAAWTSRSYLARRLRIYVDSIQQRTKGTVEADLELDDPPYQRTLSTTRALFRKAVDLVAPMPIVAFQASPLDRFGFEEEAFALVCEGVPGLDCIPDMLDVMRTAARSGRRIDGRPRDGHWNRAGHWLAAERILRHLHDGGYLPSESSAPGSGLP